MTVHRRQDAASREPPTARIEVALRRVVVGYRFLGAAWLTLLAVAAATPGVTRLTAAAGVTAVTVAVVVGWSALTAAMATRRPELLGSGVWIAGDVAIAALAILAPTAAGAGAGAFYGGYPFSAVLLAATTRGLAGGLPAGAVLATVAVGRLAAEGAAALPEALGSVLLYIAGAALVAWGAEVLRRHDAERRAAEATAATERAERIASQERAEAAADLHDSVLQTLALIQRASADPARVTTLARRCERELRGWLAGGGPRAGSASGARDGDPGTGGDDGGGSAGMADSLTAAGVGQPSTFAAAVREVAAEVEAAHHVRVEVVTVGDAPLDDALAAAVAATREALLNAATHARAGPVSLYAEVGTEAAEVFVRDRGRGFDPAAVHADRRGIRESIVGRMARHGGEATVRSAPGQGTEVALRVPHAG